MLEEGTLATGRDSAGVQLSECEVKIQVENFIKERVEQVYVA